MSQSVDEPAVAAPAPSFSRANFVWTDCAVKLLINAAHKHEAYKKTPMKMDQKWELVRAELVLQPTFQKWTDVTAQNLRQKFNRFKEEVNAKYGFDREGANLSGLDEVASDSDRMMTQ